MARRKKPDDTEYTGRRIDHVSPFGGAAIMGNRGGYQSVERTPEEIAAWQRHNATLHQDHPSRRTPEPRRIDYVDGAGHAMVTGERGGWRGVNASPAEIAAWQRDHGGAQQREAQQREARGRRVVNPKEASIFDAPQAAPEVPARQRRGHTDPKETNIFEPTLPAAPAGRRRGAPEIPPEAQGSNIGFSSNRLQVPHGRATREQFLETGYGGPDQKRVVHKGTSYEAIPRLGSDEVGVYRNPNGRWVQVHPGNNGADRQGRVSHGNQARWTEHISAAKAHELIANGAVVGKDLTVPRRDRSPGT